MMVAGSPGSRQKQAEQTILRCAPTVLIVMVVATVVWVNAGDINPPAGPVAPTMKSLDQVEARIIVNATNTPGDGANTFIISAPGSYYFTGNITGASNKHGISIQADDVTLDLNGFSLINGGGGAPRGVNVPAAQKGLCIRNGTVQGWTDGGVRTDIALSTLVEKLRLIDNSFATGLTLGNGSARDCVATGNLIGFILGNGAQIKDCAATGNTTGFSAGERSQITNCIATVNTGVGFSCTSFVTLIDCTASRNFGAAGIVVQTSCTVMRCNASRNIPSGDGITAGAGCTIADCTAGSNGSRGITAGQGCTIRNCTASANADYGIFASDSVLTGNTCFTNGNHGISNDGGSTTNCVASYNAFSGFVDNNGCTINCTATHNGGSGINSINSVLAFCVAASNNQNHNGSVDFNTGNTTRTGNNPAP